MDKILGIAILFVGIAVGIYVRGLVLRSIRRSWKVIYKDLALISSDEGGPSVLMYLVSIFTIVIGPVSYEFIKMNDLTYILMNLIAAVFFAVLYPPLAPITGFATIDVLEKGGSKYCVVGKILNRKYKLVSIQETQKFEIIVTSRNRRITFTVANPLPSRK